MKKLKLSVMSLVACLLLVSIPARQAHAGIYEIIKAAVVKAIKAADLAIQRQQNRIVWLQNAQKVLENTLSKLKLDEISDWTEKQKEQYAKYFDELKKVKMLITYYQQIREITDTQVRLVDEYGRVWNTIRADKYFTADEIEYMAKIYTGILEETVKNIDQLALVVNSFRTQMSDAKRLEIINEVADHVDMNYADLKAFNAENGMLRLQRSRSDSEVGLVKRLYGLN